MPPKSKQQLARVALVKRGVPVRRTAVHEVTGVEAIPPDKDDGPGEGGAEGPARSTTSGQPEGRAATLYRNQEEGNQEDLAEDTVRDGAQILDAQDPTRLAG
jgi:hypothetical protein